ncbi:hypothetical protein RvY_11106 [Ramazzottius varieornatus]|uniref:Essential MCU regulator, mitochondrial n=1 Tax=Ramazzottius varieornatus TaxID=947166 RepID=A0A1D1VMT8_RAMVA|nr:hypothetical protein RvY_11106 [Ramazzottius varieornatus]
MLVLGMRRALYSPAATSLLRPSCSSPKGFHPAKAADGPVTSSRLPALLLIPPRRWESSSSAFLQSMMANKMLQNVRANRLPPSSSLSGRLAIPDGYCPPAPPPNTALRVLLAVIVASGGVFFGSLCSQLLSRFLEENDIFVPSDED